MAVAPAEQTGSAVSRMLMPEVSPCKHSAFRSRSEEQLINGFLTRQQLQVCTQARDLTQADKILKKNFKGSQLMTRPVMRTLLV
jgi:hypothetical protein